VVLLSAATFSIDSTFAAAPNDAHLPLSTADVPVRTDDEHTTIQFSPKQWLQAVKAGSNDWSRTEMLKQCLSETKLEGMDRKQVIELLGQPQRSDAVLPSSAHQTIVDFYRLSQKNKQHFRVEYNSDNKVLSSYFEPTPLVVPRYMGQGKAAGPAHLVAPTSRRHLNMRVQEASRPGGAKGKEVTLLPSAKLNHFLSSASEEELRKMTVEDIQHQLGEPIKQWPDSSHSGGRHRHWLTFLYSLSPDQRTAFIVTFDSEANHVYEYRSITLP
jgi:hypothetical protein